MAVLAGILVGVFLMAFFQQRAAPVWAPSGLQRAWNYVLAVKTLACVCCNQSFHTDSYPCSVWSHRCVLTTVHFVLEKDRGYEKFLETDADHPAQKGQ